MDTVCINGLKVETVIGVYDWERAIEQTLTLDLELEAAIGPAAASDIIDDAVDYGAVAASVSELCRASRCQLVESLAEAVAAHVLAEFPVNAVRLRIAKPVKVAGAGAFTATVAVERRRA